MLKASYILSKIEEVKHSKNLDDKVRIFNDFHYGENIEYSFNRDSADNRVEGMKNEKDS